MTRTPHPGPRIIALVGATASGKSDVALALAERFGAHIVNYDSVQLYRGLEIGAAKPTPQERARFPHHLYELAGPEDPEPTAGDYARAAGALLEGLSSRGERVLLVGGTGLYLRALRFGLAGAPPSDPEIRARIEARHEGAPSEALYQFLMEIDPAAAARILPGDRQRILRALIVHEQTGRGLSQWQQEHGFAAERFPTALLGLAVPRETLYKRIDRRSAVMLERGLLAEVEGLLRMGYRRESRALRSIGYRHALEFLAGEISKEDLPESLARDTRRYAKRQLTWWRKEAGVRWLDPGRGSESFIREASRVWEGER